MLLDAPTLAAVALCALAAAIVSGMSGFGTGVILAAVLVPLIGVKAVIPVLAVAGVIINAGRFWFYRQHVDRRALGTVLGAAVIAFVPLRRFLHARQVTLGTPGLAVGSGIFGFAMGIATGTGVILVSLLLGAGLATPAVLATDALVSILLDLCKAALFQRFDLLDGEAFFTGVVIGVASIPGSAIAAWLVARIGTRLHVMVMEVLILLGGISMLWHAWR